MKKGILYFVFAVSLLCVVGWFYWRVKIANTVLQQARNAMERSDYPTARVFSEKLLKIRPDHPEGILILAESTYKDETLTTEQRQDTAFELLARISDSSKYAAKARLHEASILLFDNLMPVKAENALRRALDGEGEKLEIYRSLFQLYCCTSRETLAEPIFREMIGLAESAEVKQQILTDWFLSQFSTATYNSRTNLALRVEQRLAGSIPADQKRLLLFRQAEPKQTLAQVALANWFLIRRDGKQAKVLLDELDPDQIDLSDPLYLTTAVNIYLEVGEIEIATSLHENWTSKDTFEYWRQKGVIAQDFKSDYENAIPALENALQHWPGPMDPSLYHRLETCYQRIGDSRKAEFFSDQGNKMKITLDQKSVLEIRKQLLTGICDREFCEKLSEFYAKLERSLESNEWKKLGEQL